MTSVMFLSRGKSVNQNRATRSVTPSQSLAPATHLSGTLTKFADVPAEYVRDGRRGEGRARDSHVDVQPCQLALALKTRKSALAGRRSKDIRQCHELDDAHWPRVGEHV